MSLKRKRRRMATAAPPRLGGKLSMRIGDEEFTVEFGPGDDSKTIARNLARAIGERLGR